MNIVARKAWSVKNRSGSLNHIPIFRDFEYHQLRQDGYTGYGHFKMSLFALALHVFKASSKGDQSKMQQEREQYTTPQLKLVGETDEVVLGGLGLGGDIAGMFAAFDMEFQED